MNALQFIIIVVDLLILPFGTEGGMMYTVLDISRNDGEKDRSYVKTYLLVHAKHLSHFVSKIEPVHILSNNSMPFLLWLMP